MQPTLLRDLIRNILHRRRHGGIMASGLDWGIGDPSSLHSLTCISKSSRTKAVFSNSEIGRVAMSDAAQNCILFVLGLVLTSSDQ